MALDIAALGASFLGSSAGALVGDSLAKGRTEWNKDQQLDLYRKAPTAQMEGLRAAGLNPMLAYQNVEFGGVAPGAYGAPDYVKDYSSVQSSAASASQAESQARQVESNVGLQKEQANKAFQEAGLTENSLRIADNLLRAMANHDGVLRAMSMSNVDQGIEKFLRAARVSPELQNAAASIQERLNSEELHKLLNVPAANELMKFMQLLLRVFVSAKR